MSFGDAFIEYSPSKSVTVTVLVPFTKTFAPGTGIASFAEVTIPLIVLFSWAERVQEENSITTIANSHSFLGNEKLQ